MRHPFVQGYTLILVSLFFISASSASRKPYANPRHFVLVHGACVGAWSWYKLVPPLQSYGHNVTAIDLAASGINLVRADELRTFSDYTKPLMDFMESIPDKVILVGHSLGGAAISQAMELFPDKVYVAVFLSAFMPGPSLPLSILLQKVARKVGSTLDNKLIYEKGPNNAPTTLILGPKFISQVLYQYSLPQDVALGIMLMRPLSLIIGEEGLVLSKPNYGSVNRIFIISEKDRILPKQFDEWMINQNRPNRVETIRGSDHMVMTSQPSQLLALLLDIAKDY